MVQSSLQPNSNDSQIRLKSFGNSRKHQDLKLKKYAQSSIKCKCKESLINVQNLPSSICCRHWQIIWEWWKTTMRLKYKSEMSSKNARNLWTNWFFCPKSTIRCLLKPTGFRLCSSWECWQCSSCMLSSAGKRWSKELLPLLPMKMLLKGQTLVVKSPFRRKTRQSCKSKVWKAAQISLIQRPKGGLHSRGPVATNLETVAISIVTNSNRVKLNYNWKLIKSKKVASCAISIKTSRFKEMEA